jgi:hypothetical protein
MRSAARGVSEAAGSEAGHGANGEKAKADGSISNIADLSDPPPNPQTTD